MKKLTLDQVIAKAKIVHGDKFDYSNSVYVNMSTKTNIICNNGHTFPQTFDSHIFKKTGCPYCSKNAI